jgi:transcriptional regulator with XRE-family HTH domain
MIDPKNKFAEHLATLMEEHDPPLGIKELAEAIGITYEHARRLVRGLSIPSPAILIVLADVFGVDRGVLQGLAKTTKFERQYGRTAPSALAHPEVEMIAKAWNMLSEKQRAEILTLVKRSLHENNKNVKAGK